MSEPFVGEIRIFAGNFAPRGWALCEGQLLAISQHDALFSLFGTIYGGDGRTTFGLPDMRGRVPVHAGSGPGLSNRRLGDRGGQERVTLQAADVHGHAHALSASSAAANAGAGPSGVLATTRDAAYGVPAGTVMAGAAVTPSGSDSPAAHDNLAPSLAIHYIVALFGIYPSRS